MRAIITLGILAAGGLALAQPAAATVVQWDGSGATDDISWGQLGAVNTLVLSGTGVTSADGLNATVTSPNTMERRDEGDGWAGSFATGEQLLFTGDQESTITITFGTAVSAAGAQIQSNLYGAFTARITLNDGSFFDIAGTSGFNHDDSAPFLGAISDSANITSITFSVPSTNGRLGFAISQLELIGGGVPEPATWALMLLGFGTMGLTIRRGRKPKARAALA